MLWEQVLDIRVVGANGLAMSFPFRVRNKAYHWVVSLLWGLFRRQAQWPLERQPTVIELCLLPLLFHLEKFILNLELIDLNLLLSIRNHHIVYLLHEALISIHKCHDLLNLCSHLNLHLDGELLLLLQLLLEHWLFKFEILDLFTKIRIYFGLRCNFRGVASTLSRTRNATAEWSTNVRFRDTDLWLVPQTVVWFKDAYPWLVLQTILRNSSNTLVRVLGPFSL